MFVMLLFVLQAEGQNGYKHEIGIGLGYIEYNPDANSYYLERWHNSLPLKNNSVDHYLIYFNKRYNQRSSFPAIYYTYYLGKKLSISSSFQYTKNKGKSDDSIIAYDGSSSYTYIIRKYDATIGLNYNIYSGKKISIYTGIHLNAVWTHSEEDGIYNDGWTGVYNQPYHASVRFSDYYLLHHAGVQYYICKRWNVKYELGIRNNDMFYLRPLNRLSVNYQF